MLEGVVAAMEFCIESEKKKEMGELVKNRSNSEGIEKDQAGMDVVRAAEAMYNSKNSDGSLRNYFCEKESFTSQQRLGLQGFEEKCNEENGLPSWIGSGNGGAKQAVEEFIPRLDLSAVGSCSNSINLFPTQSGFGSPIAVVGGFERRTSSGDDQDDRPGFVTSTYRPSVSTITGKQSTAQLTIFYGATVNVYDDIPRDKAQAIMLIASSGNCSKYPHTKVQNGCGSLTELKTSLPLLQLLDGSGIDHQPVSSTVHTDLPIKRKQSLQRFLQKRKDRVIANAKPPYKAAEADNSKPRQDPLPSSPLAWHSNSLS